MTGQRIPEAAPAAALNGELPFVSVLMPVRNEERYIGPCLQALAQQDYPRERFEVIVLDGESGDRTAEEAADAARAFGVPDVFLTNKRRTTATGFNLGLTVARGDVIIKVDGHTLVDPAFISAGISALIASGADAVGGPIASKGRGPVGQAIALAVSSPFGVGDAAFRHSKTEQWTDTVPFGAYRREVFDRIGPFAEDVDRGEDDEFNYRLGESGGRILLTPRISSIYYARSTYADLWRQYWGYGLAKARVLERHPARLRWRHLVPSAFLTSLAGAWLLGYVNPRLRPLLPSIASTYACANLAASLSIAARGRHWRILPFIPPAFATIHLAAGTGLIAGFLRRVLHDRRV